MPPQPVVTMDPSSWNDDWESEEKDDDSPVDNNPSSPRIDYPRQQSVHNDRSSSGWLQDVFEGVRLTAVQSGQEILQASSVLTSGIIQKALPKPSAAVIQPNHDDNSEFNEVSPLESPYAGTFGSTVNDIRMDQLNAANIQPSASIDSDSWNEEWDCNDGDSQTPSPTREDTHKDHASALSEQNQYQRSGWFQDVLEGVRITALQSGQEIMQVSSELTSGMISKTLSRNQGAEGSHFPDSNPGASNPISPASGSSISLNINLDTSSGINQGSWNHEWDVEDNKLPSSPSRNPTESVLEDLSEEQRDGAGWLQDVFQGVRFSAVQSGQEILHASGALTSGVLRKAKTLVPFREDPEPNLFSNEENNNNQISSFTSSSSHTLNEMFSGAKMVFASNMQLPDKKSRSDDSSYSDASITETSEFLWNFPCLDSYEDIPCDASFDSLFSQYGGAECESTLDMLNCKNLIRLERIRSQIEFETGSIIKDVINQVFQESSTVSIKSTLVTNLKKLSAEIFDWHRTALEQNVEPGDTRDMFLVLDQLRSASTHALAILSARSVNLLLHSIQQWAGNSEQSRKFALVLRNFMVLFNEGANSIARRALELSQQLFSASSAHEEDIEIFRADLEVDIFQANVKIEDAVSNVIPLIQCMALSD